MRTQKSCYIMMNFVKYVLITFGPSENVLFCSTKNILHFYYIAEYYDIKI